MSISGQILADSRVAFMAALSNNLGGLPDLATLVFDSEITNVGHAYQPATGIFTAPVKGVYTFTLTFMVEPNHHEYVELTVDGRVISGNVLATAVNTNDYESTTREWVLEINKGAQVLIRTSNFGNEGFIHGNLHTVWSGFLLFETE